MPGGGGGGGPNGLQDALQHARPEGLLELDCLDAVERMGELVAAVRAHLQYLALYTRLVWFVVWHARMVKW
jgi:hypothetical protein